MLHDSPRNCVNAFAKASLDAGREVSVFLNPWASRWPERGNGSYEIRAKRQRLEDDGITTWFDPMTHILNVNGVGDFRYYDDYPLWSPGLRGALDTSIARRRHFMAVAHVQDELRVPHLMPTRLLHAGASSESQTALDLAHESQAEFPDAWQTIAGTPAFWESDDLDAHIGALAQVPAAGWVLHVVRSSYALPAEYTDDEVFGLMRSVLALSQRTPVMVAYGDLAALPAVSVGASAIGTGWDQQQRNCGFDNFGARTVGDEGGTWYTRGTMQGLLATLTRRQSVLLQQSDPALHAQLGGPAVYRVREVFLHHLGVLDEVTQALRGQATVNASSQLMAQTYRNAEAMWDRVQAVTSVAPGKLKWIRPLLVATERLRASEGW